MSNAVADIVDTIRTAIYGKDIREAIANGFELVDNVDEISDIIAKPYSPSSEYKIGEYVLHESLLYRCTTNINIPESWNSSKWESVQLSDELMTEIPRAIAENYRSLLDMPANKYTSMNSTVLLNMEPALKDISPGLFKDTTYLVFCYSYSGTYKRFIVERANGSQSIYGYTYAKSPNTIVWFNTVMTREEIEEKINSISGYDEIPRSAWTKDTGMYTRLLDMPVNRYTAINGARIRELESVDEGDSNDYKAPLKDILDGSTYAVFCYSYSEKYKRFIIERATGSQRFYGYTSRTNPDDIVWFNNDISRSEVDTIVTDLFKKNIGAVQVYTEFALSDGWYKVDGSLVKQGTVKHTEPVAVLPNTTYYMTKHVADRGTSWAEGAFFNLYGDLVGVLSLDDYEDYSYRKPDAENNPLYTDNYVELQKFVTPDNAYYFSYNARSGSAFSYNQYISNVPVYCHSNTGNTIIRADDPVYQYFGKRKLCVIGPSTVMIDRLLRTGNFNDEGSSVNRYVVGFQEYLAPYWKTVDSYGYSGSSYGKYDIADGANHDSIYTQVVSGRLNLSGYDDYLLISSGNYLDGTKTDVGDVPAWNGQGNVETYIGALWEIIKYIYSNNSNAKVYLTSSRRYSGQYSSTTNWNRFTTLNTKIREICDALGCQYIDLTQCGFNQWTNVKWCYDGNGDPTKAIHWNHEGSREIGLFIRRAIVGV